MIETCILKKDNIMFSSSQDMHQLCQPLFQYFDIGNVMYLKVFPDMSRVHLDTDPHWAAFFYQNIKKYYRDFFVSAYHWESGYSPLLALGGNCVPDALAHGVGEGVVLSKREGDCTEIVFITHNWQTYRDTKLHLLLRNIDLLQLFFDYFRKEAKDLIDQAAKDPVLCPLVQPSREVQVFQTLDIERESFIRDINKRYNKDGLTPRELDCIYYTSLDMTAKEIARQLNVSPKTVERHLENAKSKFGCRTKAALIKYAGYSLLSG
jgi:DNA-binding CsgD family transcriptional regulator